MQNHRGGKKIFFILILHSDLIVRSNLKISNKSNVDQMSIKTSSKKHDKDPFDSL